MWVRNIPMCQRNQFSSSLIFTDFEEFFGKCAKICPLENSIFLLSRMNPLKTFVGSHAFLPYEN